MRSVQCTCGPSSSGSSYVPQTSTHRTPECCASRTVRSAPISRFLVQVSSELLLLCQVTYQCRFLASQQFSSAQSSSTTATMHAASLSVATPTHFPLHLRLRILYLGQTPQLCSLPHATTSIFLCSLHPATAFPLLFSLSLLNLSINSLNPCSSAMGPVIIENVTAPLDEIKIIVKQ